MSNNIQVFQGKMSGGFKGLNGFDIPYGVNTVGTVVCPSYTDKNGFLRKAKILKQTKRGKGYLAVGLMKDGKKVRVSVHRLVAEAFIPNPENKPQVNHIDGNKLNNSVSNLEWVTNQENIKLAFETGLKHSASHAREHNNMAKLQERDVVEIRVSRQSVKKLAKKFNVSESCVYKIRQGIRWTSSEA